MVDVVWKGVIGRSDKLSLNKFFDWSTPSMRKGRNRETKRKNKTKIMMEIVATNVIASRPPNGDRLQCRSSCQLLILR